MYIPYICLLDEKIRYSEINYDASIEYILKKCNYGYPNYRYFESGNRIIYFKDKDEMYRWIIHCTNIDYLEDSFKEEINLYINYNKNDERIRLLGKSIFGNFSKYRIKTI